MHPQVALKLLQEGLGGVAVAPVQAIEALRLRNQPARAANPSQSDQESVGANAVSFFRHGQDLFQKAASPGVAGGWGRRHTPGAALQDVLSQITLSQIMRRADFA